MPPAENFQKASRWAGNMTLGILVVALYWLFVAAVFAGFASYMTRSDWTNGAEVAGADHPDLDTLFHLMNREAVLKANINATRAELADIDLQLDIAIAELEMIELEKPAVDGEMHRAAAATMMDMRALLGDFANPAAEKLAALIEGDGPDLTRKARDLLALAPQMEPKPTIGPERIAEIKAVLAEASAVMQSADEQLANLLARQKLAERTRDRHLGARQWPSRQIEAYQSELRTLSDLLPINSQQRARMGALSGIFWGVPHALVGFPTIFLTLIVTIAAGGLGAVVSFSRAMFRDDVITSRSRLFVSVGEGIAAAIVIFLFSGAGFLALAPGTGSIASLEISPYTVAFVAFLSGFMAEDAFARIQRAGKRLFASDEDATRPGPAAPPGVTPPGTASPASAPGPGNST